MHSVSQSPSGWYPEVKWSSIWSSFPSKWKKCDTNSAPQSEVTWDGALCFEKTWASNNCVSWGELSVLWVGMQRDCLVSQLTVTKRVVTPLASGRRSMKSLELEPHSRAGTRNV